MKLKNQLRRIRRINGSEGSTDQRIRRIRRINGSTDQKDQRIDGSTDQKDQRIDGSTDQQLLTNTLDKESRFSDTCDVSESVSDVFCLLFFGVSKMPSFKLFTAVDSNPKVSKVSERSKEWIGVILHLAPHKRSGYQVCPEAHDCINPCLNLSGHGRMDNVQDARKRKTVLFFENRDYFLKLLDKDIVAAKRYADKLGKRLSVRLNGTSDLFWESLAPHVFANNPDIQFHDYTKVRRRYRDYLAGNMPANYYLTFSYQPSNNADSMDFLAQGGNLAVVFPDQEYPQQWNRYDVINGDEDDFRFLDPKNVIVALYAKGPAKKETNGFVVTV